MKRRTTQTLLAALLLVASSGLTACSSFRDLDSVELRPADDGGWDVGEERADAGDVGDGGLDIGDGGPTEPDTGDTDVDASDAGDVGADVEIDVGPCGPPVDWTSGTDFGDINDNFCDPVEPGIECNSDPTLRCGISVYSNNGVPEFISTCKLNSAYGPLLDGEACGNAAGGTACQLGLHCVPWSNLEKREPRITTCNHLCEIGDDRGCPDDYFCVQEFPELEGLGVCVPSCDPYDTASCPADQVCAPDFAYPEKSHTPRFRCRPDMAHPAVAPALFGEACSMGNAGALYRYCAGDNICYPRTPGETNKQATCVRPCQSDADCEGAGEGLRCSECGEGPWDLRFCEPAPQ